MLYSKVGCVTLRGNDDCLVGNDIEKNVYHTSYNDNNIKDPLVVRNYNDVIHILSNYNGQESTFMRN